MKIIQSLLTTRMETKGMCLGLLTEFIDEPCLK